MEKTKFEVKPTKINDIISLKDNLRQVDIKELTILGSLPLNSLLDGYLSSDECYSTYINNQVAGIFGFNKKYNCIWFLGSDLIDTVPFEWIKTGKKYINHFLELSPVLKNTISLDNKLHIKWLKKMGARFSAPYLINNTYFQDFFIIKGD